MWHGFFVSRCVGRWPLTGPCERRALARERRPFPRSPVLHLTALESLATGLGCWNGHGPRSYHRCPTLPISQPVTLCQHALPVISPCLHCNNINNMGFAVLCLKKVTSTWCIPDIAVHSWWGQGQIHKAQLASRS